MFKKVAICEDIIYNMFGAVLSAQLKSKPRELFSDVFN